MHRVPVRLCLIRGLSDIACFFFVFFYYKTTSQYSVLPGVEK